MAGYAEARSRSNLGDEHHLRIIDLFAGCGGFTEGFVAAGFEPSLAVEWEADAAATYAANYGDGHMFLGDIEGLPDEMVEETPVVIGGPPCQGFSALGARDVDDPRNKLWQAYLGVLLKARPQVFVMENVDRFFKAPELQQLFACARPGGTLSDYVIEARVLNAVDYGVPQRRRRTIVVGSRLGAFDWPEPTHGPTAEGQPSYATVRDAIGDVPLSDNGPHLPIGSTVEYFGRFLAGPFKEAELHVGRRPKELSLRRYDCIPPGGGRFDLPDSLSMPCWRAKPTGTSDVMGRLRWDAPAVTIRTEFFKPEKGRYLHPQWEEEGPRVNRALTHLEAARLQTFPSTFQWCGTKISIARQIGNAVPPLLAQRIAEAVKRHLGQF